MSESERLSLAFYAALGAEGLAARTSPEWDAAIVARLTEMLPSGARVLDVGCGYGRVSIPLAASGYRVDGIDLSPVLVEAARTAAQAQWLEIDFRVGSMTKLQYASGAFDAVLCLWSAFHKLLEGPEQVAAIAEMWRVTAPGGFVLVEGPRADAAGRVTQEIVSGLPRSTIGMTSRASATCAKSRGSTATGSTKPTGRAGPACSCGSKGPPRPERRPR